MIRDFLPVARVALGLRSLKVFSFGPRPHDFLTCHAPIKPLFDLGVEVMENSELDMYDLFLAKKGDPRIKALAADMAKELGRGNTYPDLLEPWRSSSWRCWTTWRRTSALVLCRVLEQVLAVVREVFRVHALLHQRPSRGAGIPISCESDIYGALSEYSRRAPRCCRRRYWTSTTPCRTT